ncbi:MAG: hypothetical protein WKF41_09845 [Gaiellaceae bacterium]
MTPAEGERDLAALRRLYPLYLHDLSAFTEHYVLDAEAQWQPSYLEDWLGRTTSHSLLIRVDGRPAGFALVAERPFPHMPQDVDFHSRSSSSRSRTGVAVSDARPAWRPSAGSKAPGT